MLRVYSPVTNPPVEFADKKSLTYGSFEISIDGQVLATGDLDNVFVEGKNFEMDMPIYYQEEFDQQKPLSTGLNYLQFQTYALNRK